MRKKTIRIISGLCILCGILSCQEKNNEKKWKLVWEENFDQTDRFDENAWVKVGRGTSDWNNYMSDFDSCYAVKNGNLILRGLVNYSLPNDTAPYITGGLETRGKVNFTYGKMEIKAKLQGATGAWPAIWMLPQHEKWPVGGEIDIMERLNDENIAYQTVHSNYTYNLNIKDPNPGSTGPIDKDDYNIYAVEIYPDSLVFSINGNRTFAYPKIETDKDGQYPFGKPFYLILSMQLGGAWVGAVDPKDLPVEMKIDWVKYYQEK